MAAQPGHETQVVCVGRYLMDIPAGLKQQQKAIGGGGDATFYFGHDDNFTKTDVTVIESLGGRDFESAIQLRESELNSMPNFSTDGPMLISRESVVPGAELLTYYASADSTEAVRLEMHFLVAKSHVVLAETAYSVGSKDAIQAGLISMLSKAQAANTSEATVNGGFCVRDVVFNFHNDYEEAEFRFGGNIAGTKVNIQVDLNTFKQAPDEPPLVERGEANLAGFGIRPEKLRAGPRQIASEPGDEWLGAFVEGGHRLHGFYAETRARNPTLQSPKVHLSLLSGEDGKSASQPSIEDVIAVSLWDRMLASIRRHAPKS